MFLLGLLIGIGIGLLLALLALGVLAAYGASIEQRQRRRQLGLWP